jgi:hypothetical protein
MHVCMINNMHNCTYRASSVSAVAGRLGRLQSWRLPPASSTSTTSRFATGTARSHISSSTPLWRRALCIAPAHPAKVPSLAMSPTASCRPRRLFLVFLAVFSVVVLWSFPPAPLNRGRNIRRYSLLDFDGGRGTEGRGRRGSTTKP